MYNWTTLALKFSDSSRFQDWSKTKRLPSDSVSFTLPQSYGYHTRQVPVIQLCLRLHAPSFLVATTWILTWIPSFHPSEPLGNFCEIKPNVPRLYLPCISMVSSFLCLVPVGYLHNALIETSLSNNLTRRVFVYFRFQFWATWCSVVFLSLLAKATVSEKTTNFVRPYRILISRKKNWRC